VRRLGAAFDQQTATTEFATISEPTEVVTNKSTTHAPSQLDRRYTPFWSAALPRRFRPTKTRHPNPDSGGAQSNRLVFAS
jgi:hypothetical protein